MRWLATAFVAIFCCRLAVANSIQYTSVTLAGVAGGCGYQDGTGSDALFCSPKALAIDGAGNIFTVDNFLNTLREITPLGVVTTVAGLRGEFGEADGTGGEARFNQPSGTAVDSQGNIYIADSGNCTVRKVTPGGAVTTLAGTPGNCVATYGTQSGAGFDGVAGIAVDQHGNVFVGSYQGCTITEITPAGVASPFVGQDRVCGESDGTGTAAELYHPSGLTFDNDGNLYVADETGHTIRKITPAGVVTTLAGNPNVAGFADGIGVEAEFDVPSWVAVDDSGNVFVTDYLNAAVREVSPDGVVTTIAGSGMIGSTDGTGSDALFNHPDGIAVDSYGNVFVADRNNNTIRELIPESPEPSSWALLAGGLVALLMRYRRRVSDLL